MVQIWLCVPQPDVEATPSKHTPVVGPNSCIDCTKYFHEFCFYTYWIKPMNKKENIFETFFIKWTFSLSSALCVHMCSVTYLIGSGQGYHQNTRKYHLNISGVKLFFSNDKVKFSTM